MKIYKNDNGYSMSPAAEAAYQHGEMPASKINRYAVDNAGIDESVGFVKWLLAKEFILPSSKHHTSKFINLTAFYDLEELKEKLDGLSKEDLDELKARFAFKDQIEEKPVSGTMTLFVGKYRNYKRRVECEFEGVVKGKWLHVTTLDGRSANFKKKYPSIYIQVS